VDCATIESVRRFNRFVTQRVGALHDDYLHSGRSLGADRVLWEIADGTDVRDLRVRLDLDSGYLSRLLRSLEADGLVEVTAASDDRRVRTARLTRSGRRARAALDRGSDALVRDMLEPLSPPDRDRLVTAMADVERLLTAALVTIDEADAASDDVRACLDTYFAELQDRFDDGFDASRARAADGVHVVARLRGAPIGCGVLCLRPRRVAEIKRMWVSPAARGLGLGRRLLQDLEARAVAAGVERVRLDTNRALTEAIAMYRSAGYREVRAFNDEVHADHWFEKRLG
jgi:DNA-binding MarR family transcriptional regulator/ribosomal protein S18 acetylase RimI-like enzyme